MRADRRARDIEVFIEDVLAMFSPAQPVVDDEREDDVASGRFAVGNIFAPPLAPGAMSIHSLARIAAVGAVVPKRAAGLRRHMIGRRLRDSFRERQRRSGLIRLKKLMASSTAPMPSWVRRAVFPGRTSGTFRVNPRGNPRIFPDAAGPDSSPARRRCPMRFASGAGSPAHSGDWPGEKEK